ncbi:hypothetical protein M0R36_03385 [bacterium]|nr:hypothetical protein [bacterium]
MPGKDGRGPLGRGSGAGGQGLGRGVGGGNRPGSGPGGNCVCPNCGAEAAHQAGVPCYSINCPKCGTKMMRQ